MPSVHVCLILSRLFPFVPGHCLSTSRRFLVWLRARVLYSSVSSPAPAWVEEAVGARWFPSLGKYSAPWPRQGQHRARGGPRSLILAISISLSATSCVSVSFCDDSYNDHHLDRDVKTKWNTNTNEKHSQWPTELCDVAQRCYFRKCRARA